MRELSNGTDVQLTPQEAQEYQSKGYVLIWKDKIGHRNGEPSKRIYYVVGRWGRND